MEKISSNNAVASCIATQPQVGQDPNHQVGDDGLGKNIGVRHRAIRRTDDNIPSRQLVHRQSRADSEGQCPHCGHSLKKEDDDDIAMSEGDAIHSDEDSSDDEPGCCSRTTCGRICISALIATSFTGIGWFGHSIITNDNDSKSTEGALANPVPPVTPPVSNQCKCDHYRSVAEQKRCRRMCEAERQKECLKMCESKK